MARTGRPKPGMVATGMALALVLAAALLALLATPPADAASRYRVVTKTFSNAQPITINDKAAATPYPSPVAVSGLRRGKILDVNVRLRGFNHTAAEDVDVLLEGPGGQNAFVMSDAGGVNPVEEITLGLDDEASKPLPSSQLVTGTYKPTNHDIADGTPEVALPPPAPALSGATKLGALDATNPNGTWNLYVADDFVDYDGQFADGWSVTIKAKVRR